MVTWADATRWDPDAIGAVADELNAHKQTLVGLQDEVDDAKAPGSWIGDAADAARSALGGHVQRLEEITAGVSAVFLGTDDAEASATTNRNLVDEVLELAARHHFAISETGQVTTRPPLVATADETRAAVQEEIELKVLQVLNTADQIDNYLADIMERVANSEITDGDAGSLADAAAAGERQISRSIELERMITEYQVDADPDGMVTYRRLFFSARVTASEAEMMADLNLLELKDLHDASNAASSTAEERFPEGNESTHDHRNAFQHAYWNALLVKEFGAEWAERYGTAHEMIPGNPADEEAMDLRNNEVGRQIAVDNPDASSDELADLVEEAVRDGRTVVLPDGGGLQFTDRIDTDQAGDPGRLAPEAGGEIRTEYDTNDPGDPDNYD